MLPFRRLLHSDDAGQSLIEFALVLPLLQMLAFGYAATTDVKDIPFVLVDEDRTAESRALVERFVAQANGTTCVSPPTLANPCFATVRVTMPWHTITPWPLIPNTFNFDRSTTMRMMNY